MVSKRRCQSRCEASTSLSHKPLGPKAQKIFLIVEKCVLIFHRRRYANLFRSSYMFKKGFFYIALLSILAMNSGCSSSSDSGEDLDISEIKEIETTGEFSEDEFFSADDGVDTEETALVDEVAGLDEDITDEVTDLEDGLSDELNLDDLEDGAGEDVAALEGSDILDDLEDENLELEEDAGLGTDEEVTVSAEDLGFDESETDLFENEGDAEVSASVEDEELDLDSEDDLFREEGDEDLFADTNETTEVADFDEDFGDEVSASETVSEEVSIDDVDYSDQVATNDQSASDLLGEDDVSIDDVDYASETLASTKTYVPVKKMQTVPYSKNGVLVNGVYFVRDGDTLDSIASKIYGNGSAVDFKIVNSHLRPGALKVGQKVYYNSPRRSQDRSRLLTYYEDTRMPVLTYSAAAGENIRKISENLLGSPRSWMEVWATNQQIESKWDLEAPYRIRYWQGNNAPAPTLARKQTPPPAPKPVAAVAKPVAPKPEVVAKEEAASQASLNLDEPEEDIFEDPIVADEETLDEPDMELDEPAEVAALDEPEEDIFDEIAEEEPTAAVAQNNNRRDESPAVAGVDGRGIARNKGGFQAKSAGLMTPANIRKGSIAGALILLLIMGFLVIKRRRQSQSAIEMESFDFGGETTIDDTQDKTQIDL